MNNEILRQLMAKGVCIPNPETVYISDDVDPDRISGQGVTLHGGTKLIGSRTLIMANAVIGYEAPVTLENTLVGPASRLNGGFFQGAVFMGQNVFGAGGHVRSGTILEEEANAAHTVGLKQTILFPFVTLGSLINFCDCLMAGGTSRKNHSEVGSSFIHFNYTPNQDKATPSMFGNVHQGVMLNQPPVFLGGQGGVAGPVRLGFGCLTAAGSIVRKSDESPQRLILGGGMKNMSLPYTYGVYSQVTSVYRNNLAYIAGLNALRAWYGYIRPLFATDALAEELVRGLQQNLSSCIEERIKRLMEFGGKLAHSRSILAAKGPDSEAVLAHDRVRACLNRAEEILETKIASDPVTPEAEHFIRNVQEGIRKEGHRYVQVVQGLSQNAVDTGSKWLRDLELDIIGPLALEA